MISFRFFSRLGPFPQVSGQVKEWLALELHKTIGILHLVTFPIGFILFYEQRWQGGVFKFKKDDRFLVFLAVWVIFPQFLWWSRSGSCYICTK